MTFMSDILKYSLMIEDVQNLSGSFVRTTLKKTMRQEIEKKNAPRWTTNSSQKRTEAKDMEEIER